MLNQNIVKVFSLALFATFITVCLSVSSLAQGGERLGQEISPENDFGLLRKGIAIPGVDVALKKKPGDTSMGKYGTDHEGNFNLGSLAPGIYSLTPNISADGADQLEGQMAKTYTESKSNTSTRAMVVLEGVKSMAVITSMEMQRNRFFGHAVPAFAQVYEIQFEVVGWLPVTGTVSIAIEQPGIK